MNVHSPYIERQEKCTPIDMDVACFQCDNGFMQKNKPRHFLREHREKHGYTLEYVAARVEDIGSQKNLSNGADLIYPDTMTHVTLSRIENGKQPYKQQLLEILAEIYATDVASLIMRNPLIDAPHSILDGLPKPQYEAIINMIEQFKKNGTTG